MAQPKYDIKATIDKMVAAGKSEDEIRAVLQHLTGLSGTGPAKPTGVPAVLHTVSPTEPDSFPTGAVQGAKEGIKGGLTGFGRGLVDAPGSLVSGLAEGVGGLPDTLMNPSRSLDVLKGAPGQIWSALTAAISKAGSDPEGWGRGVGDLTGQTALGAILGKTLPKVPTATRMVKEGFAPSEMLGDLAKGYADKPTVKGGIATRMLEAQNPLGTRPPIENPILDTPSLASRLLNLVRGGGDGAAPVNPEAGRVQMPPHSSAGINDLSLQTQMDLGGLPLDDGGYVGPTGPAGHVVGHSGGPVVEPAARDLTSLGGRATLPVGDGGTPFHELPLWKQMEGMPDEGALPETRTMNQPPPREVPMQQMIDDMRAAMRARADKLAPAKQPYSGTAPDQIQNSQAGLRMKNPQGFMDDLQLAQESVAKGMDPEVAIKIVAEDDPALANALRTAMRDIRRPAGAFDLLKTKLAEGR